MKSFAQRFLLMLLVTAVAVWSCGREGPEAPPDLIAPAVKSMTPYPNQQDVPLNTEVKVIFTETLQAASVNAQSITLQLMGSGR